MAYRDDFYIAANIVGYTGQLNNNPTVYFSKQLADGILYGHITQHHNIADNIGREKLNSHPQYVIQNENHNGMRAVEKRGNNIFHYSRSLFVPMAGLNAGQQALLTQAIANFQDMKKYHSLSFDEIVARYGLNAPNSVGNLVTYWENMAGEVVGV